LVAWKSGHLASGDLRQGIRYIGDIVACRVDRSGRPLETRAMVISSAPDLQERPRIAFGDGVFLVVWHDIRNGRDWDIYACRVTPDGKVLDTDGLLVSGGAHNQAVPDVAWDGTAFQVVWQDFRSGTRYEVYGARVSPAGDVLEAGGLLLVTEAPPHSRIHPVVAAGSKKGTSLLFWLGGGARAGALSVVAGCHLLKEGRVAGDAVFENKNARSTPGGSTGHLPFPAAVTAGPTGFLVLWTTDVPYGRGNAPNDAHAALFTSEGEVRKKVVVSRETIRGRPQISRIRHPDAAWDGSAYVATWHQRAGHGTDGALKWPSEAVFSARVTPDATANDRQCIAGTPTSPAVKPAVASDGAGRTLIVYEQHPEDANRPICIGMRLRTRGE
jgi:hypothetical protein